MLIEAPVTVAKLKLANHGAFRCTSEAVGPARFPVVGRCRLMVVAMDAGLLAVAAVISATAERPKRCRESLRAAVDRLERQHGASARTTEAAQCLRNACFACARCPGL
jgi:hypothetical protein